VVDFFRDSKRSSVCHREVFDTEKRPLDRNVSATTTPEGHRRWYSIPRSDPYLRAANYDFNHANN
jgi:hypothetical protein